MRSFQVNIYGGVFYVPANEILIDGNQFKAASDWYLNTHGSVCLKTAKMGNEELALKYHIAKIASAKNRHNDIINGFDLVVSNGYYYKHFFPKSYAHFIETNLATFEQFSYRQ